MDLRDLFFKTTAATPAAPHTERPQPEHVAHPVPEAPPPTPTTSAAAPEATAPEVAGPAISPDTSPAPIEAAQDNNALVEPPLDEGPIHIPHRGPAPFRPQTERVVEATPPDPVQPPSPKPPAPQLAAIPPEPRTSKPAPSQYKTEIEPRERPREKRAASKPRIPRHSSGWAAMLQHLKEEPSLRVLDIGPTSPNNINFLTGMGHSVYMADIVQDAIEGNWTLPPDPSDERDDVTRYDVDRFYDQNFNFGDRRFEVVLLWTTIDYLPDAFIPPLVARLKDCMEPGGKLLAFFHTRSHGADTTFCRYHLVDSSEILMQEGEPYPVQRVYTNREIERTFKAFSGCRFFLARDNVYEVIIKR